MPFAILKPYLIGAGVAALIALVAGAYITGRIGGGAAVEVAVAKNNVKIIKKVMKDNDKIDKDTPFAGDDNAIAGWLLKYTRAD